jgi:hypothetical protein
MSIPRPWYNSKRKRRQKQGQKTKFKQGYFTNISEKYQQPKNKYMNKYQFPEYRSSWELQFMKYCEVSDLVKKWTTESIAIPYISPKDGQPHRYFPDFAIEMEDNKKFLIEIKPSNQCNNPINKAKWEAAKEWSIRNNFEFLILTEKELKKWGIIK